MTILFWSFSSILAIVSFIAIRSLIHEEKLYNKRDSEQKARIGQLEQELNTKRNGIENLNKQILELKGHLLQNQDTLKQELNKKERETEILLTQLKNDFSDKEKKLNAQILELKDQLLQSQDALKKEVFNKSNLEKKLSELEAQLVELNKDLSSNIEMFNGLKGQHDDLEREMEKLQEKYEALLKSVNSSKVEKKDDAV